MTQKEFMESYTKQQSCVTKMLYAMKNNDTEVLAKHTPVLLLEIFKNHNLTDKKSSDTIDKIVKDFLLVEDKKTIIPSIEIMENEDIQEDED